MINRKVFLVAGHDIDGDPGAVFGAYRENYETVQITDLTAKILQEHGLEVIVDPHTNDMYESVNYINARCSGIDDGIVIDIHKNSFSQPAYGFETWIMRTDDPETVRLGNLIQVESIRSTGLINRGVKKENWYVITNAKCRGVLVECGFINGDPNTDEYDLKYALGIAKGILAFFGIAYKEPAAPVEPVVAKISYKAIPKTRYKLINDANLWDFNFTKWADAKAVKSYPKDTIIEAVAIATNETMKSSYLMSEYSYNGGDVRATNGFNIKDCVLSPLEPPTTPETPKPDPEPIPEPETPTEPVNEPDYDKENNTLLKTILDLLTKLIEKIGGIFR